MAEFGRNKMASKIARIINHGFDGDARRSGKTEDELFEIVMGKINELKVHTTDDVLMGLAKAEGTHHTLLEGGQRDRAQSAISRFLDRYLDSSE